MASLSEASLSEASLLKHHSITSVKVAQMIAGMDTRLVYAASRQVHCRKQ